MKTVLAICLVLTAVACGRATRQPAVSADQIGLSKVGISEVPEPPRVAEDTSEPGEQTPTPPAYAGSPPVISHGIADLDPITPGDNMCLDCHEVKERIAGEPTPIPESHYMDLRNRPDEVRSELAGARYVCTSCHAGATDAAPLVGSTFRE